MDRSGGNTQRLCRGAAHLRAFLLDYRGILLSLIAGLFYFFFAVFPIRSPIDRRAPWLKWLLLAIDLSLGLGGIRHGQSKALPFIAALGQTTTTALSVIFVYGAIFLGLLSLMLNVFSTTNLVERRKLKVILWGTTAILPMVLVKLAEAVVNSHSPFWLNVAASCCYSSSPCRLPTPS